MSWKDILVKLFIQDQSDDVTDPRAELMTKIELTRRCQECVIHQDKGQTNKKQTANNELILSSLMSSINLNGRFSRGVNNLTSGPKRGKQLIRGVLLIFHE